MDTRCKLLQAASEIVLQDGTNGLTLDAVAKRAQVSKGGLLYHFASKEALVEGLIDILVRGFEEALAAHEAVEPPGPGRLTRAYLRAKADMVERSNSCAEMSGLLAAVANRPELLCRFRERMASCRLRLADDGIDPATAAIVQLAADGLTMTHLLDLHPPTAELRGEIVARLVELTHAADGAHAARPLLPTARRTTKSS